MMYLLRNVTGAKTGGWVKLRDSGMTREKATLYANAQTWGAVTIEVSPDGIIPYPVTVDGNATITADGAWTQSVESDYIRATSDGACVDVDVFMKSYG